MRIACHMLRSPGTPAVWANQAIDSMANQAATLTVLPGIEGHLGCGRIAGFKASIEEHKRMTGRRPDYLSWIDDDDLGPVAGAFRHAELELDRLGAVSVYSNLIEIDEQGDVLRITNKPPWSPLYQLTHIIGVHHLHVMRTDAVLAVMGALEHCAAGEEWLLMALLTQHGDHHRIPLELYRWRRWQSPGRALCTTERRLEVARLGNDLLLQAIAEKRQQQRTVAGAAERYRASF